MGTSEVDMYYDREGNQIGRDEYHELFEDKEYQIVKQTMVHGFKVSTVWLGSDHNMSDEPGPIIFETMVFRREEGSSAPWDEYETRYETERDALVGHVIVCDLIAWHYTKQTGTHEWVKAKTPNDQEF